MVVRSNVFGSINTTRWYGIRSNKYLDGWSVECGELPIVGEYGSLLTFRTPAKRLGLVKLVICRVKTGTLLLYSVLYYTTHTRITIIIA